MQRQRKPVVRLVDEPSGCVAAARTRPPMHPASQRPPRVCTAVMEAHPVWSLNEPSTADSEVGYSDGNDEQNCILRENEDWRRWVFKLLELSPSGGYWCA